MDVYEYKLIVKSPTINIGQMRWSFRRDRDRDLFLENHFDPVCTFREKRFWIRRWSSEVQGLVATNPEDISKMDVVGIVPSVLFEPGTDLYGWMLAKHRQVDDGHSKRKRSKGNA